MPIVVPEICLRDVLIPHPDLVIPRVHVYLRELLGSSKLIHQPINARNGVAVIYRLLVERPVIDKHAQGSILFLHQNN